MHARMPAVHLSQKRLLPPRQLLPLPSCISPQAGSQCPQAQLARKPRYMRYLSSAAPPAATRDPTALPPTAVSVCRMRQSTPYNPPLLTCISLHLALDGRLITLYICKKSYFLPAVRVQPAIHLVAHLLELVLVELHPAPQQREVAGRVEAGEGGGRGAGGRAGVLEGRLEDHVLGADHAGRAKPHDLAHLVGG